jgi:hypothetical protein
MLIPHEENDRLSEVVREITESDVIFKMIRIQIISAGREESTCSLLSDYKSKIGRPDAPGDTEYVRRKSSLSDQISSDKNFFFADVIYAKIYSITKLLGQKQQADLGNSIFGFSN